MKGFSPCIRNANIRYFPPSSCFCSRPASGPGATNLVRNGSFNTPGKMNLRPALWCEWMDDNKVKPAAAELIQNYLLTGGPDGSPCIELGHSYERFLAVKYNDTSNENYARFRQESTAAFAINAYACYKFSVQYITENVTEGNQACTELDMFHGTSFIDTHIYHMAPSSTWKTFTAYFRPIRSIDRGFADENGNTGQNADHMRIRLGLVSSLGKVRFDNASVTEVPESEFVANAPLATFTPASLTARRAKIGRQSNPARVITVKKINGAWWMLRADGRPFWLRAVQNPKVLQAQNPELFFNLASTFKNSGATSTNTAYRMDVLRRLGALGFNAEAIADRGIAASLYEKVHPKGECYIHFFCPDAGDYPTSYLCQNKDGDYYIAQKPMPDPYNPGYKNWLRNYIRGSLDLLNETYANNGVSHPDFCGYYTDNEMGIEHIDDYIWSPYCAQEFIKFIRARYNNDIGALNKTWTSRYASFSLGSFEEITSKGNKAKIVRHHLDDPLAKDLNDFTKKLIKDYYRLWCTYIRQYECEKLGDANGDGISEQKHLIFTNRFAFSQYPYRFDPELTRAIVAIKELCKERPGYYFDVLCLNGYQGDGGFEGITTKGNFNLAEKLAKSAGLEMPVFISDFGVAGRDAGIPTGNNYQGNGQKPNIGWYWRSVNTQADRGRSYEKMVKQWASSPLIIGAQWFQWSDLWQKPGGSLSFPVKTDNNPYFQGRNCGVVDKNNKFYSALTDKMLATNKALDAALIDASKPVAIRVDAPTQNFGDITVGAAASRTMIIFNDGYQSLTVSKIEGLPASGFSIVTAPATPFTIGPNQSRSLGLRFTASSLGAKNATLKVTNSDASQNPLLVALTGNGVPKSAGKISVGPTSIDFAGVAVSYSKSAALKINNTGTGNLRITSLEGLSSGGFSIDPAPALPFTIGPGQNRTLTLMFTPTIRDTKTANLIIRSDDPAKNALTVPLKGFGGLLLEIYSPTKSSLSTSGLVTGQNVTLKWCLGGVPGNVRVTLYRGDGQFLWSLTPATGVASESGQWIWNVSPLPEGDYQLVIKSMTNTSIKYTSTIIHIKPGSGQPWIKITQPSAAVTWRVGQKVHLAWDYANLSGKIQIALFDGEDPKVPFPTAIDLSKRALDWVIPATTFPRAYTVRLTSQSSAVVKIATPVVTITP